MIKMKSKFNTNWKASKQPRKQRKYRANAPLHIKKKFVNVNVAKDLRKKVGKRTIQVKKGDKVKIMRGKFKGKSGKVTGVKIKRGKIYIENIQVKKMDGSKANVPIKPSNLQIIEMADRSKKANVETKKKSEKKVVKENPKEKTGKKK